MVRFGSMSYSDQTLPSPSRGSSSSSNSGAQYATATLGVGLIALGIVMIVWSVVPSGSAGNSSRPGIEPSQVRDTSSVAFVLVGGGIALLLLSVCLSIRNKRRASRGQEASNANAQERAMAEQLAQSYMVPSYEEVVESGQYPISQSSLRNNSTTQLPAYEELMEHQLALEDGSNQARRHSSQTDPSTGAGGRRKSHPGSKLIPLKMRCIKSENIRRKSLSDAPQSYVFTIEPLTPPPHYDDKPPPLLPNKPQ
ncbi:transmembrane protein 51a [Myxocyprinus asiaticus]|uniref:transmembrane protein 51a n=1 Tax=Myxocyprinus asiaticus TaxID=70543 RepID=UPI0022218E75|nr:transmembrane protein 51a [Myxocyprinus asiaticus]XP_051508469.1 transmembrane protein 51a [Myxocyprinus asiaticus]XP_051508470.1 transmembrane protein 51a [Myxocyprinus asiaticus]